MSFGADLRAFARRANKTLDQAVRAVQLQALELPIEKTPVDTGQAKGGWHTSIGTPSTQVGGPLDPTGAATIARGRRDANVTGSIFYVVNNLPYISALEYGSSNQAPEGMVRISVIEIRAAIRSTVRNA